MNELIPCPLCGELTHSEDYNFDVHECKECHSNADLPLDECGCEQCYDKTISEVDFED